jgi:hypothetical protein
VLGVLGDDSLQPVATTSVKRSIARMDRITVQMRKSCLPLRS